MRNGLQSSNKLGGNMKRISYITLLLLFVLQLNGCSSRDIGRENGTEASTTKLATSEYLIYDKNREIKYTEEEQSIVQNAIGGDKEGAERILTKLNVLGLYHLEQACLVDESNEKLEVVINEGKHYILWLENNFNIEAIQRDGVDGEFIFMEVND